LSASEHGTDLPRHENISLHEAACLLCFSSKSSFTRATNRWFNSTPRELRLQISMRP
jgi:AraC-like DNA-binding protein